MAPFLLTKTEKILHTTICGKGYADSLLGRTRCNFGALHAQGNTVTSVTYADLLKNHLRPPIKSKRRGLLSTGDLLQHDNARFHKARSTVATIQDLSFECLPHPSYSPDLAPSDFHFFGPHKKAMGGKSFRSDEEVQQALQDWLRSQPKDFFF
jgi:histone-lysine N-methyltransferase SETMAR